MTVARRVGAVAVALALLGGVGSAADHRPARDERPNVVVILTDDQPATSLLNDPPVMRYLEERIRDPADHWIVFPNAFVVTPMCCPSRATLLTGRFPRRTGVLTNADGHHLDGSATLPVWLDRAGYHTGLVGKYLNGYPFGRAPFVPPGWDRWTVKQQGGPDSVYHDYTLIEQGLPVRHGSGPHDYLTDVLAERAVAFIRSAPADRPFFLLLAPTAPHPPWTPAPRHAGRFADLPVVEPPSVAELDVTDKPAWVAALPALSPSDVARLQEERRLASEALLAVDEAVRAVLGALRERGVLERTVILYATDNGAAFGEHRLRGKGCPYAACTRIPFLARVPGQPARVEPALVSLADVAPTVAELTGAVPRPEADGMSLAPLLMGEGALPDRPGVFMEWAGGVGVPAWEAIRTPAFLYVELATGERELYDLSGRHGAADPFELENRAEDPRYSGSVARLAGTLRVLGG